MQALARLTVALAWLPAAGWSRVQRNSVAIFYVGAILSVGAMPAGANDTNYLLQALTVLVEAAEPAHADRILRIAIRHLIEVTPTRRPTPSDAVIAEISAWIEARNCTRFTGGDLHPVNNPAPAANGDRAFAMPVLAALAEAERARLGDLAIKLGDRELKRCIGAPAAGYLDAALTGRSLPPDVVDVYRRFAAPANGRSGQ